MTQPLGEEFILIKPLLAGFRAELEAQLAAALRGVQAKIPVVAAAVAVPRPAVTPVVTPVVPPAAAARAAEAAVPASTIATTERLTTATAQAAAAERSLAAAATEAKAALGGIVLPAGVRDVVTAAQSAAAAQAKLATATIVTKEELAGIVLPPGIRSVTVATNEAAAAQTNLARASRAAKTEIAASALVQQRTTPGGVILPAGVGAAPVAVANKEAARAQQQLAESSKATRTELESLGRSQREAARQTQNLTKNIQTAETAAGRYSRGMLAATAASTGFFRAVSFASGAFLVGAAVGATIGAAVNEFKQMTVVGAQTAAVIRATGESANVTAEQIDALGRRQLRLTGVDDELIKSSANILLTFRSIRNEVGAGNDVFNRAVKAVQDISSVFNTDMRGSAVQVGKALQDPIRGVTALRRSGITLSQSQRDLVKQLVETGRQFTAQKLILNEIERQVGGTAQAIGRTLPGQLAILRESTKNSLGEFVKRMSESRDAARAFSATTGGIGDAFRIIGPAIKSIAGAIALSVKGLEDLGVLRPLVEVVTLAAVAFGALKLALGTVTLAETLYTRATTIATAATVAQGVAAEEAALAAGASAAAASAAGTAAAASAARVSLAAGALAALKGPLGIALGITAVAIGFIKLRDALADAPGTINATRRALDGLSDAIERSRNLRGTLAGAREDVSVARFDVLAGQRTVARAQAEIRRSPAQAGSIEQIGLANRLADAQNKLADANKALANAERRRDRIEDQIRESERTRPFIIAETTKSLREQIDALTKAQTHILGLGDVTLPFARTVAPTEQLKRFDDLITDLIAKGTPLDQQIGRVLRAIRQTIGDIPDQKQIALVVRLVGEGGRSLDEILAQVGAPRGTEAIRARGIAPPVSFKQQEEEALRAGRAAVAQEQKRLGTLREIVRTRKEELATAREQLDAARQAVQAAQDQQRSARQALADARQAAREARQNVVDTIAAGRQAINDAVTAAKNNLDQLGQAIAEALGKAGDTLSGGLSPERFKQLRDTILRGGGGPETQRVRQQLQSEIEAATPAGTRDLTVKFADLTNAFNTGKITLEQFRRQFNALLKGFDVRAFRREFGSAAAETLQAQIRAARRQAALIEGGPQRRGGGTVQTLVNPLEAVAQSNRDVAAANRQVSDAVRGIRDAQRDVQRSNTALLEAERRLRTAQTEETKANTRATRANTRAAEQLATVLRTKAGLQNKPKPKAQGAAARDAGDINLVGANSP